MTQKLDYETYFLGYCSPPNRQVESSMLEGIFGNASAEKILLYLEQYEEGYATAIARTFDDLSLNMAQRQLERFERAGALVSSLRGRTRLYTWNPRYPFRRELRALLRKALDQLPASERKRYFTERRRPRRAGKPL
jgi:DNA-binding transcriptional ArsR family regulator